MALKRSGSLKLVDQVLLTSVNLATEVTGALGVANGGTGQSIFTNGQLLIGNTTGNTLTKATLTAGAGISITNGTGTITIAATSTGDVVGPASATDNAAVRFDAATGKLVQDSHLLISDLASGTAGVGVNTGGIATAWGYSSSYLNIGPTGSVAHIAGVGNDLLLIGANFYVDSAGAYTYKITSEVALSQYTSAGDFKIFTAPSGTAGTAATMTERFAVANTGMVTIGGGITVTGASTITGTLGGITTLTATTLAGTLSTATQNSVTTMTGLTTIGTLVGGTVPAARVSAGTFGAGAFAFAGALSSITTLSASGNIAGSTGTFGAGIGTGDASLTIGEGRSGDGNAFIDLVGDTTYTDFGLRIRRYGTANGASELLHRGTASLRVNAQEAAAIEFYTTNALRGWWTSAGLFVAATGATVTGGTTTVAAAVAAYASLNIPDGVRQTTAVTGDVIKTTQGIFWRDADSIQSTHMTPLPRYKVMVADSTHSSTTPSAVTNLVFATGASGEYWRFKVTMTYASSLATVGIKVQINTPTFTSFAATVKTPAGVEGTGQDWQGSISASGGIVTASATPAGSTKYICTIEGIINCTAAGTVQILVGVEAAGTVTVYADSHIEYARLV